MSLTPFTEEQLVVLTGALDEYRDCFGKHKKTLKEAIVSQVFEQIQSAQHQSDATSAAKFKKSIKHWLDNRSRELTNETEYFQKMNWYTVFCTVKAEEIKSEAAKLSDISPGAPGYVKYWRQAASAISKPLSKSERASYKDTATEWNTKGVPKDVQVKEVKLHLAPFLRQLSQTLYRRFGIRMVMLWGHQTQDKTIARGIHESNNQLDDGLSFKKVCLAWDKEPISTIWETYLQKAFGTPQATGVDVAGVTQKNKFEPKQDANGHWVLPDKDILTSTLSEQKRFVQDFMNCCWQDMSGKKDKAPFSKLTTNAADFIDLTAAFVPQQSSFEIKDPSHMSKENIRLLIQHWKERHANQHLRPIFAFKRTQKQTGTQPPRPALLVSASASVASAPLPSIASAAQIPVAENVLQQASVPMAIPPVAANTPPQTSAPSAIPLVATMTPFQPSTPSAVPLVAERTPPSLAPQLPQSPQTHLPSIAPHQQSSLSPQTRLPSLVCQRQFPLSPKGLLHRPPRRRQLTRMTQTMTTPMDGSCPPIIQIRSSLNCISCSRSLQGRGQGGDCCDQLPCDLTWKWDTFHLSREAHSWSPIHETIFAADIFTESGERRSKADLLNKSLFVGMLLHDIEMVAEGRNALRGYPFIPPELKGKTMPIHHVNHSILPWCKRIADQLQESIADGILQRPPRCPTDVKDNWEHASDFLLSLSTDKYYRQLVMALHDMPLDVPSPHSLPTPLTFNWTTSSHHADAIAHSNWSIIFPFISNLNQILGQDRTKGHWHVALYVMFLGMILRDIAMSKSLAIGCHYPSLYPSILSTTIGDSSIADVLNFCKTLRTAVLKVGNSPTEVSKTKKKRSPADLQEKQPAKKARLEVVIEVATGGRPARNRRPKKMDPADFVISAARS